MSSGCCTNCKAKSLVREEASGNLVCEVCGFVQEFDNFDAQLGSLNGPQGTNVRCGDGIASTYKERKIYGAKKSIEEILFRLGLSNKYDNVETMVNAVTEGEYGQGRWLTILVGACAYIVMRRENKLFPIARVAADVTCDVHELGRMITRVVQFLNLKEADFPEFDIVVAFERVIMNLGDLSSFAGLMDDIKQRIRKQGMFLIQCAVKWFLTTGRTPLPVVAAVLVLVAEVNQIEVRIEDVAKEVHAVVSTSRRRYKELLEALVKVAQALPWGKNVTVKNIIKNAPLVIQYMEMKSMSKPNGKRKGLEHTGFDLEDVVSQCLSKELNYGMYMICAEDESKYFNVDYNKYGLMDTEDMDSMNLSPECLSMIYTKFVNEADRVKLPEGSEELHNRLGKNFVLDSYVEWWSGKSKMSKKLLLKQIVEKDVGLDTMPPSFVSGCLMYDTRREKINAAKHRIRKIMHPSSIDPDNSSIVSSSDHINPRKKGKRSHLNRLDGEDLVIELLLLHKVKDEEIEKGYYNNLLDLHVFIS